jgi:hypothetical protein
MAEAYLGVCQWSEIFPHAVSEICAACGGRPRKSDNRSFENFGYVLLALSAASLLAMLLKASGVSMKWTPITARRDDEVTSRTVEWTRAGQSS